MVSARRFSRGASRVMRQAVAKCIYDIADIICVLDTHVEVMWPSSPGAELLYAELYFVRAVDVVDGCSLCNWSFPSMDDEESSNDDNPNILLGE